MERAGREEERLRNLLRLYPEGFFIRREEFPCTWRKQKFAAAYASSNPAFELSMLWRTACHPEIPTEPIFITHV